LGDQGPTEVVALRFVAALGPEECELVARFHAFGAHVQAQAVRHPDDGPDDRCVVRLDEDLAHERLVDLEAVEREAPQIAERRVARAEVVDGEPHARAVQLFEDLDRDRGVAHRDRLRDFDLEVIRLQARARQQVANLAAQRRLVELARREVDREP